MFPLRQKLLKNQQVFWELQPKQSGSILWTSVHMMVTCSSNCKCSWHVFVIFN